MIKHKILSIIKCAVLAVALAIPTTISAFSLDHYTETSALASGRWVKVQVETTGLQRIPAASLRAWGFSDPAKVKVYGYGGNRIADLMLRANYVDDLPQVASEYVNDGLVFFGNSGSRWVVSTGTNYHRETNPYSTYGYYFLCESDDERLAPAESGVAGAESPTTIGTARVQYERDLVQATEAGPLMVGEDMRYTPTRSFSIATPGRAGNMGVWMECQMFTKTLGAGSDLTFKVNGETLSSVSSDKIAATTESNYIHGNIGQARHNIIMDAGEKFDVTVSISSSVVIYKANLDYIALNYIRNLDLNGLTEALEFSTSGRALAVLNADADTRIWDVTDTQNISAISTELSGTTISWMPSYSGLRNYVAWKPSMTLALPTYVGVVSNQNLHDASQAYDMVIFTPTALKTQAERIASLHTELDGMQVNVVDINQLYNEFSSGTPDVSAMRKYLKMLYDRQADSDRPLKYALIMGRVTLDNRYLLSTTNALGYTTTPSWLVTTDRASMSDNDGYATDDVIAMLADGSGKDLGLDDLSIAVGRIPAMSASDATEIVDKLEQYMRKSKHTGWRNRILLLADDEDLGVHLRQTDAMADGFLATDGQQHVINKVYLDAYNYTGGEYPDARRDMFRYLEEGVVWWFYVGHANNHSWTGEGQLTFTDINSMYLKNLPFIVASTCDFLRWDSETTSGGEIMYKERYGGAIGMISATRPVYISDNGYLLEAYGRHVVSRDDDGRLLTAGEVYRRAKNDIINSRGKHDSNPNRLRFVFMGDPAMRLVNPDNIVELLTIDGQDVDPDAQLTIAALANTTLTGRVVSPDGSLLEDFNGTITIDLFDATTSVTTNARGNGSEDVFDTHGDKLYAGAAKVVNGEFSISVAMPSLIADNFREATLSMYAVSDDEATEAIGVNRDFYVYGFADPDEADTTAPEIKSLVLNHSGFKSGDKVNSSPLLMAEISDNVGINISAAGIGQQITATIDGSDFYSDLSIYYTPATDGTASGTISYPFEDLTAGAHSLTLRVFDTSGNATTKSIDFYVDDDIAPQIFEVYTDANPASTGCNFYVRHDRPENIVSVTVTVYDLMGRALWSGTAKGMSDGDVSAAVSWDLCDAAGRRVPRGIYVYRAQITTDSDNYESKSRRLAVTGE